MSRQILVFPTYSELSYTSNTPNTPNTFSPPFFLFLNFLRNLITEFESRKDLGSRKTLREPVCDIEFDEKI